MSRHPRRSRPARRGLLLTAAALACGPAAVASAAMVTTPDRCFVHWPERGSQTIPVAISGLAPGQSVKVELRVRGTTVSGLPSLFADASGLLSTQLASWTSGLGAGPTRAVHASIAVTDLATGMPVAETRVSIANAGLDIEAARKVSGAKRKWVVSGLSRLTGGQRYWAFYYGKGGKLVGKQPLGRPDRCGYLLAKQRLIPFDRVGTYELRVQASRTFREEQAWIGGTVTQRYRRR